MARSSVAFAVALALALGGGAPGQAAPARSSSLALTPDGALLAVANPDSGSLTLLDTVRLVVLAEVPVGRGASAVAIDPAGARAYVVGRLDDSLTAVDLVTWRVAGRREVGAAPRGVVTGSGGRVYVAAAGGATVTAYDAPTLAPLATTATEPGPHGLVLSADGATLYVTHFQTGRVSVLDAATLAVRRVIPTTADANLAASLFVDETTRRAYLPATRANAANPAPLFDTSLFPIVSVIDLAAGREIAPLRIALDIADRPVSRPTDALLAGGRLWVLHAGSGDLSVLDLDDRRAVAHLEVGENPTGLALAPDGATLYVYNQLDGTVTLLDVVPPRVRATIVVTTIPLPPAVRRGKVLFHSSRPAALARDRWISCASCHPDGEADGRTWSFPDGPRNTTSLLGVGQTLPVHWSGDLDELQDVETTIRTLQAGTGLAAGSDHCEPACDRGPPNAGRSAALDDLAAFMRSLSVGPSPQRTAAGELTPAARRGREIFARADTGCARCHPGPLYTDRQRHEVGTGDGPGERKGPFFDTPSLRGVHGTAPYLHDGRATTLLAVLTAHNASDRHGATRHLSADELADLVAFLQALPFEANDECQPDGGTLCLLAGRLRARATFTDPRDGVQRAALAVRAADGGGGFAFFDPQELDLTVKALDAELLTGSLWVIAGSLTGVPWELVVDQPETGASRTFRSGAPGCGAIDVRSFPVGGAAAGTARVAADARRAAVHGRNVGDPPRIGAAAPGRLVATPGDSPPSSAARVLPGRRDVPPLGNRTANPSGRCAASPTTLCLLDDRFAVEASWRHPVDGAGGPARALPLRERSGLLSFFSRDNPEVAVKLLDGRALTGGFWLFHAALTDLDYELVVTDTWTEAVERYVRPAGSLCGGADLELFTTPR